MDDHFEPARMTDGQLASQFAIGADREAAFRELVRRHAAMVLRTCHRITGNTQDAEDAAQLVFATLANRAGELTSARSLGGWLYSTAWHISQRNRRSRHLVRQREHDALRPGPTDLNGHVDEETVHELYRAIEMLPPEYCEAIVLHHLNGLTVKEVSNLMGCAPGTTAARLSRGRAMMRERLLWRGLVITAVALEAALLAELNRRANLLQWVTESALSLESMEPSHTTTTASASSHISTAHAGAGAVAACGAGLLVGGMASSRRPGAAAAWSGASLAALARTWICVVCIGFLGLTAIAAVPSLCQSFQSLSRTHLSVGGSASAESTAAGMVNVPSHETASRSGAISSVPEPGSFSLVAVAGVAMLRRRRRA